MSGGVTRAWLSTSVQHFEEVPSARAEAARQLALQILSAIDRSETGEDMAHSFNSRLLQRLNQVVLKADSKGLKVSTKAERMWRDFHALRGTELCLMWNDFLQQLDIAANEPLLLQYLLENIFGEVVKSHFSTTPESTVLPDHLSAQEQNTIRYVAGYVPHALKKKIRRGAHSSKDLFIGCLENLAATHEQLENDEEEEETLQSFTAQWISRVDRGGLFIIRDEVYSFFLSMEMTLRKHFVSLEQCRRVDRKLALDDVISDEDVLFFWDIIAYDIDDESASLELLTMIAELWITVHGFASASAYVEAYKAKNEVLTAKKSALRKNLKKNKEEKEASGGTDP